MALKVGIQLYSVKENMAKDSIGTIRKVVDLGYKNLEAANHNAGEDFGVGTGTSVGDMSELLKEIGAKVVNAHVFPFTAENAEGVINYHKAIGNDKITCAMAFYDGRESVLAQCKYFNEVGAICKNAGMKFVYHNHFHEFQKIDGETIFDIIVNNTDPELVYFEIDTFWTYRGGVDPVDLFKKYGDRIILVHQKDFAKDCKEPINIFEMIDGTAKIGMEEFRKVVNPATFTEIGTGILDIQSIIDAAIEYTAAEYIILEQDMTALGEMESIEVSMEAFKKFAGIEW